MTGSRHVRTRSASGSPSVLVWSLFLRCFVDVWSSDMKSVKVKAGDDAFLPCDGPRGATVQVLEWTRPDLKTDQYVFFYRERRPYVNYQLSCFRGRVALRDPDMKDGNAAVVLKNATVNDTGIYECRIQTRSRGRRRRTGQPVVVINLTVTEPGPMDGDGNPDGLAIGFSVAAFVVAAFLVSVGVKYCCSAAEE